MAAKDAKKKAAKEEVKKGDVWKVPFHKLHIVPDFNVRKDFGDIESLAKSIEENGVQVPFQGFRDGEEFYIIDGGRRYAALELLNKRGVHIISPFIVEPKGSNEESRILRMVLTNDGKPLNPLELAEAVRRLIVHGWSDKEVATSMGRSAAYIGKLQKLINAPKKFRKLVEEGLISATFAIEIVGSDGGADAFLDKWENGQIGQPGLNGKAAKVTKKSLAKVDSWKFFKKFSTTVDESRMNKTKKDIYDFLIKISANEVMAKDFHEFFNQE